MVVENTKGPITQTECRLEVGEAGLERGGVGGGGGGWDSLPAAALTLRCTKGSPRNPDWTPLSGTKETCSKSLPLFRCAAWRRCLA